MKYLQTRSLIQLTPAYEVNQDTLELEETQVSVDLSKLQRSDNLTWGEFLSAVGMKLEKDNRKTIQNVKLARVAIGKAVDLGCTDWEYVTLKRRFIRI